MRKKILVVTSTPGFGELIKQTLMENGAFGVTLIASAAEAIGLVQESTYALAILDSDVEDFPSVDLIPVLRKVVPSLPLVLIPPEDSQGETLPDGLEVQGLLSKPFYLPDLLALMEKLLGPIAGPATTPAPPRASEALRSPVWLEDVSRAAQHLTGLLLGTAAQAALIVRQGRLWAYAGQLAQPAAQELATLVANYWEQERELPPGAPRVSSRSDLARFIRLGSTGGEYMLYATSLADRMILALAFDVETPFSKIRSQTSQLARGLASPPGVMQTAAPGELMPSVPAEKSLPPTRPIHTTPLKPVSAIPDLSEDWLKLDQLGKALSANAEVEDEQELEPHPLAGDQEFQPVGTEAITSPVPGMDGDLASPQIVLEPVIPGMVNLVYACVIIPRLPKHRLAGDLVERLTEWVGQLCLAFGWRLENISVKAGYVQWIVNVPPTTSPSYLMRILRQHTSKRIFTEFPELARDNPSGDFWAPGYLIMGSPTPLPEKIIQDFIQQIRRHQGISNPNPPRFER